MAAIIKHPSSCTNAHRPAAAVHLRRALREGHYTHRAADPADVLESSIIFSGNIAIQGSTG